MGLTNAKHGLRQRMEVGERGQIGYCAAETQEEFIDRVTDYIRELPNEDLDHQRTGGFMSFFRSFKARQEKIEVLLTQMADLEVQRKSAEARLQDVELDLRNKGKEHDMRLAEMRHEAKLSLIEKESHFAREKKHWEEDKFRMLAEIEKEKEKFKTECTALCKLDYDQRLAQAKIDFDRKAQEMTAKHQRESVAFEATCNSKMLETERRLIKEFQENMTQAQSDLYTKGSFMAQCFHEQTLKLLDHGGVATVNETRVLTGEVKK